MNCPFHAMFEHGFRMCLLTMYDRGHELRVKLMGASREIPSMICKALEGIIGPHTRLLLEKLAPANNKSRKCKATLPIKTASYSDNFCTQNQVAAAEADPNQLLLMQI